uniref:Uncharacterized protein n=1 Tax=Globodera rostochiensis TaxID=31243 RepID=A0A914GRZ2_GLORO
MLSSPTLEAQQNENEKFYDLMTAIGEHFGGKFNDAKKALELDLNAANSFLEGLHTFATREIVKKLENGKFEYLRRSYMKKIVTERSRKNKKIQRTKFKHFLPCRIAFRNGKQTFLVIGLK